MKKISIVKEKNIETQMIEAFKEGYQRIGKWRCVICCKKIQ